MSSLGTSLLLSFTADAAFPLFSCPKPHLFYRAVTPMTGDKHVTHMHLMELKWRLSLSQ